MGKKNTIETAKLLQQIDPLLPESPEEFEVLLKQCQDQLRSSEFWTHLQSTVLQLSPLQHLDEMVCYGIGNFYTRRVSAPMWQLALALLISRNSRAKSHTSDGSKDNASSTQQDDIPIYFYDPKMTKNEQKVLEKYGIRIILENERACRDVSNKRVLFFMPHCGIRLYTNLLYTNWESLNKLAIVGNSLQGYLDQYEQQRNTLSANCDSANSDSAPMESSPHDVLHSLQPFWTEIPLQLSKKTSQLHQIETAFNNTAILTFEDQNKNDERLLSLPPRPRRYDTADSSGEVL